VAAVLDQRDTALVAECGDGGCLRLRHAEIVDQEDRSGRVAQSSSQRFKVDAKRRVDRIEAYGASGIHCGLDLQAAVERRKPHGPLRTGPKQAERQVERVAAEATGVGDPSRIVAGGWPSARQSTQLWARKVQDASGPSPNHRRRQRVFLQHGNGRGTTS
jgi:hypothetical protein